MQAPGRRFSKFVSGVALSTCRVYHAAMSGASLAELSRWYEARTREPVSPVRVVRLAEILDGAGLELDDVDLVVNMDRQWGDRPGGERWLVGVVHSRYYWLERKSPST